MQPATLVGGTGSAPCQACSLTRSLRRKAEALGGLLKNVDTKRLFAGFIEWVIARNAVSRVLGRLPRVFEMLERMEHRLPPGGVIGPTVVAAYLTTEDVRRAGLLAMFLTEQGLLGSSAERRAEWSEQRRIAAVLHEIRRQPWEGIVRRYADTLRSPERDLHPRTQRMYLRAAVTLMTFSEVDDVAQLSEAHIRRFLKARPGQHASLFPWLRFLADHAGLRLSVPAKRSRKEPPVSAVAGEVGRLLGAIRSTPSPVTRRALLAKLLSGLPPFLRTLLDGNMCPGGSYADKTEVYRRVQA